MAVCSFCGVQNEDIRDEEIEEAYNEGNKSLRGRMAYSFFKTMSVFDTIARDVETYVDLLPD